MSLKSANNNPRSRGAQQNIHQNESHDQNQNTHTCYRSGGYEHWSHTFHASNVFFFFLRNSDPLQIEELWEGYDLNPRPRYQVGYSELVSCEQCCWWSSK